MTWNLTPGHADIYQLFDCSGVYRPDTGVFEVHNQSDHANSPQRILMQPLGASIARRHPDGARLVQCQYANFIGERGDYRDSLKVVQWPPLPQVTLWPSEGEILHITSHIIKMHPNGLEDEYDLPCEYRTIAVNKPWDHYAQAVRTSLIERPNGANPTIINYAFSNSMLVDYQKGIIQPDNTVTDGIRYRRIGG